MGTAVVHGEPHEGAPGERVGVRRPLAGEVGEEQEAVAARRHSGRLVHELVEPDAGRERVPDTSAGCRPPRA